MFSLALSRAFFSSLVFGIFTLRKLGANLPHPPFFFKSCLRFISFFYWGRASVHWPWNSSSLSALQIVPRLCRLSLHFLGLQGAMGSLPHCVACGLPALGPFLPRWPVPHCLGLVLRFADSLHSCV